MSLVSAPHHLCVADAEGDAPARHRVRLRHREELDANVTSSRHLEERVRPFGVEHEVCIGEVVDHHDLAGLGELDELFEELPRCHRRGRVVRERTQDDPRSRLGVFVGSDEIGEEVRLERHRDRCQVGPGEDHGVGMDRVGRLRHQNRIARAAEDPREVRQPLLGPDRGADLGLGIERHAPSPLVEVGDGLPQLRDAPRGRIPMVTRVVGGLLELLDHRVRRRDVRIAHPEIDDVLTGTARTHLHVVDGREYVRWEPLYASELHPLKLAEEVSPSATCGGEAAEGFALARYSRDVQSLVCSAHDHEMMSRETLIGEPLLVAPV